MFLNQVIVQCVFKLKSISYNLLTFTFTSGALKTFDSIHKYLEMFKA